MSPTSRPPEATSDRPRRIGIYGGTFDPIHVGHLIIASEIEAALGLDEVVFVPAGVPPHKDPAHVTPATDRLAMLQLALADSDAFTIDALELEREGRSFTVDTLAAFRQSEPDAELWFIMGGDSLADLHTWRNPGQIVSLARLAVAARPGWDVDLEAVNHQVPESDGRIDIVTTPLIGIASHEIRDRVREGRPFRYLVPETVHDYILSHRLYDQPLTGPDGQRRDPNETTLVSALGGRR